MREMFADDRNGVKPENPVLKIENVSLDVINDTTTY